MTSYQRFERATRDNCLRSPSALSGPYHHEDRFRGVVLALVIGVTLGLVLVFGLAGAFRP